MAQKVVGYREMIWTCPNCGAKNPGSRRTCGSCGAAMDENVQFEQQTSASMITDEKILEKAKTGPDIYCAYCGNRNPAGSTVCARCGADLSEGKEREHGTEHSAHIDEHGSGTDNSVVCSACGAVNPAGALKCASCGAPLNVSSEKEGIPSGGQNASGGQKKGCSRGCLTIIIILVLFGMLSGLFMNSCGILGNLGGGGGGNPPVVYNTPEPNKILTASVVAQNWQTSIQVIGPIDSKANAWEDQLPDDARNVRCTDKKRYTSDEEVADSVEVCGTPYAVDLGNGYEQLTQDCVYEVYEPYCEYTVTKTGVIENRKASGSGPNPELAYVESKYSTGTQSVSYSVVLRDENGREYKLTPQTISEYRSYSIGSEYQIEVTSTGRIVNMEKK